MSTWQSIVLLIAISIYMVNGQALYFTVNNILGEDIPECGDRIPCRSLAYTFDRISTSASQYVTVNVTQPLANVTYAGNLTASKNTFILTSPDPYNPAVIDCEGAGFGLILPSTVRRFTMSNIEIRNCISVGGAAISFKASNRLEITDCAFINNTASEYGGAIYAQELSSVSVLRSIFFNNKAENGGAIALQDTQELLLQDSDLHKNYASVAGGSIYLTNVKYFKPLTTNFTDNLAKTAGGAVFSDTPQKTDTTEQTTTTVTANNATILNNNCIEDDYTDSYVAQFVCIGNCTAGRIYNTSGCTDLYVPPTYIPTTNNNNTIAIAIVLPFVILGLISAAVYFYMRRSHSNEMKRREEYRGMIVRALSFMGPNEYDEMVEIDPDSELCALCQKRPITAPLNCGDRIVCSICRTILLECPVCKAVLKDRSVTTTGDNTTAVLTCRVCYTKPANVALPCGDKVVCSGCRLIILECPVCKTSTRERTQTF